MAELNKIEFKYASNGIEQSRFGSIENTDLGHYIIDASNLTFITHKRKFDFMRLSDLYTTADTYILNNYALSVKGANALYQYILSSRYDDSTNIQWIIDDVSRYFNNRLDMLISGDGQTSVNKVIDTFNEIESFLANISDTSTLTELIHDIYTYVDASLGSTNSNLQNLSNSIDDLVSSTQNRINNINTNIFNISTNINSSINRTINTINSDIDDLDERISIIELGGGGSSIDPETLKNYVQFKDLTDNNLKTHFINPTSSEEYNLEDVLNIFAEPYITNGNAAAILYDNPVTINTMDTSAIIGTVFNKPTITLSGAIQLNAHNGSTPVIESGTITGTVTYRKLKSNNIDIEERTYTVSNNFTLTTNNGIATYSADLSFDGMPTLYFGEDGDNNSIISLTTSIKQLKVIYPAKTVTITNGIIKGNNNQSITTTLETPQILEIPETTLYLGINVPAINFTGYSPGYYILKENIITSFSQRTGTIFNPAYPVEITQDGYYYYYVLLPDKLTYDNLKILYKGTETGIASTYNLMATTFTLSPTYVTGIRRSMTLYVAVNEQNKPVKLQTANGGSVKIIL